MVMYLLMSFMMGFTANKLFNKRDRSDRNSVKWACIIASVFVIIHQVIANR